MTNHELRQGQLYQIRVKGIFSGVIADCFQEITVVSQQNDETLLAGTFIDQTALRGFLDQLWNLNFTVLSVNKIT